MSMYYIGNYAVSAELYHHGIQGQKWGQRRYQNDDGSLTPLGRIHYGYGKARDFNSVLRKARVSDAAKKVGAISVSMLPVIGGAAGMAASVATGKLMNSYIKELKKEGYSAVFDDNANAMAPFIVFDSSMIEQTNSKLLR